MRTSIVMSTYNGEKYIIEQLDSIRQQTISPDNVIIRDDKSTDGTAVIIEQYIKEYGLNNWFFSINEQNTGWKKNFYRLIDECDADLIFLADQDDIWNRRKLELMIPVMQNENINVLVSDYYQQSSNLDINYKCKTSFVTRQLSFNSKFMWVNYPGCSYCIRKKYFNTIKKWWREWLPHDAFLFRNAKLDGSLYYINCKLIQHRMHGNNAGTPKKMSQQKDDLQYYYDILQLFINRVVEEKMSSEKLNILQNANLWLDNRKQLYETKSFLDFVKLSKFRSFYPHFKTYIKEFFISRA